jgi:hypothetical protein
MALKMICDCAGYEPDPQPCRCRDSANLAINAKGNKAMERLQNAMAVALAWVIGLSMFVGGIMVLGQMADGIGRYEEQHGDGIFVGRIQYLHVGLADVFDKKRQYQILADNWNDGGEFPALTIRGQDRANFIIGESVLQIQLVLKRIELASQYSGSSLRLGPRFISKNGQQESKKSSQIIGKFISQLRSTPATDVSCYDIRETIWPIMSLVGCFIFFIIGGGLVAVGVHWGALLILLALGLGVWPWTLHPADCRSEDIGIKPIVISELKLRDVQRHVFAADLVKAAYDPALEDRPEAFNRICVNRADDVLASGVMRAQVWVFGQTLVDRAFVGCEQADLVGHDLADKFLRNIGADAIDDAGDYAALAPLVALSVCGRQPDKHDR